MFLFQASSMAEVIKACERTTGQENCRFHPGHKLASLCKTCGILVCVECTKSQKHEKHKLKNISDCSRESANTIRKYLINIDINLLIAVDRELDAVKNERKESVQKHTEHVQSINEQGTHLKTEIDSTTNDMVVQMEKHLHQVLDSLDKHIQVLESLKQYLTEEQKEHTKVLHHGSAILKFDVGNEVMDKADKAKIPDHPNISNIQHIKCENSEDLIRKALGTLRELNLTVNCPSAITHYSTENPQTNVPRLELPLSTSELKKAHTYSTITTQSSWINGYPEYCQITSITNDTAWAGTIAKRNRLHLISSTGNSLREIQIEMDFISLSVHRTTGQLYGGFPGDTTIRSIDTESGITQAMVHCDIKPHRIKVTKDNDVLVGAWEGNNSLKRYKLTGELVHKSLEKYNVWDIDQCSRTNRVAVSCHEYGVMILNYHLTKIYSFTGLTGLTRKKFVRTTAIFDSCGNLIVGDYHNKEVYILDGSQYTLIQKVPIKDISNPSRLKMYSNILWVQCFNPGKVICIKMS